VPKYVNRFVLSSLSAMAIFVAAATSATAQETEGPQPGDEKINQLIIYGDDPCPQSKGEEIVVCARLAERERYRIPKKLRGLDNDASKQAWTQRVLAYESVAATGINSCSAVGSGGFTGCGIKNISNAYAEKGQDIGLAFGRLIAAERNKRLSGIDAESEEVELRVIEEERAAAAKKLQDQGNNVAADPVEDVDASELPTPG
jgi:hypothetical protein